MLLGQLQTVFGWTIHTVGGDNPRSLANFPMQANGAEMMRLACSMATEAGVTVCCPVHDAFLVGGPADSIRDVVAITRECMAEASRIVLDGFELATDAEIVRWPDRYMDQKRGRVMWDRVVQLCGQLESTSLLSEPDLTINGTNEAPLVATRTV